MKFFRKIHLWLSVPFGIIISLICFSGAMLIFEPEITRSIRNDVYYVSEVKGSPLPVGELAERVSATLPDSVSVTEVTIFSDRERTYQVNLSQPRRASVYIDQYTGHITGKSDRIGFFSTIFKLHRWLLDSTNHHGDRVNVGKLLVGISTLMFVVALITGVVIWWPRARRKFVRSVSITFSKGWPGFWKSLHVAGGMYALIFVVAMALTGLTWSFSWYRTAFYAVCGVENTPRISGEAKGRAGKDKEDSGKRRHEEGRGKGHRHSEFKNWQEVYDNVSVMNPDAPQITVSPGAAIVTLGTLGNGHASDRYEFDGRTGEITSVTKYSDTIGADRLRGWIYSIHTGSFGGIVTRIIWLLGALLGAFLPLTGYYIWIRRLMKK